MTLLQSDHAKPIMGTRTAVRKQTGFTLIEMLIVMAVFLIATGIGFMTIAPALRADQG